MHLESWNSVTYSIYCFHFLVFILSLHTFSTGTNHVSLLICRWVSREHSHEWRYSGLQHTTIFQEQRITLTWPTQERMWRSCWPSPNLLNWVHKQKSFTRFFITLVRIWILYFWYMMWIKKITCTVTFPWWHKETWSLCVYTYGETLNWCT